MIPESPRHKNPGSKQLMADPMLSIVVYLGDCDGEYTVPGLAVASTAISPRLLRPTRLLNGLTRPPYTQIDKCHSSYLIIIALHLKFTCDFPPTFSPQLFASVVHNILTTETTARLSSFTVYSGFEVTQCRSADSSQSNSRFSLNIYLNWKGSNFLLLRKSSSLTFPELFG